MLFIAYDPASLPSGVEEDELRVHEVRASDWEEVAGSSPDPGSDRVSGLIDGFSVFGLVAVPVASVTVAPDDLSVRVAETVQLAATPRDADENALGSRLVTWSSSDDGIASVDSDGGVTGVALGSAQIVATSEEVSDTASVSVVPGAAFSVVGRGMELVRFTSDIWVFGDYAYLGTWGCRTECGDRLYAWDISDPAAPVLTDSVELTASTVNDVKVSPDGTIAVATREGAGTGLTIIDLADPAHPVPITDFALPGATTTGVHNVWLENDYVYVVLDGSTTSDGGLRVVDVSNPASPAQVASFYGGSSILHDVYVRDGLAFLSHWDAGLIILDVGNGVSGGSPESPVEVGRVATEGGQTHNAWYWPAGGYVFVGEEDGFTPGIMHVVDASDLANPVEVATFAVPGDTPHNFWLDEAAEILYMTWYTNGLRAVDVSGELLGELEAQEREIASSLYDGTGACVSSGTCTWAPQLHNGLIFLSDMNSGLWILDPSF